MHFPNAAQQSVTVPMRIKLRNKQQYQTPRDNAQRNYCDEHGCDQKDVIPGATASNSLNCNASLDTPRGSTDDEPRGSTNAGSSDAPEALTVPGVLLEAGAPDVILRWNKLKDLLAAGVIKFTNVLVTGNPSQQNSVLTTDGDTLDPQEALLLIQANDENRKQDTRSKTFTFDTHTIINGQLTWAQFKRLIKNRIALFANVTVIDKAGKTHLITLNVMKEPKINATWLGLLVDANTENGVRSLDFANVMPSEEGGLTREQLKRFLNLKYRVPDNLPEMRNFPYHSLALSDTSRAIYDPKSRVFQVETTPTSIVVAKTYSHVKFEKSYKIQGRNNYNVPPADKDTDRSVCGSVDLSTTQKKSLGNKENNFNIKNWRFTGTLNLCNRTLTQYCDVEGAKTGGIVFNDNTNFRYCKGSMIWVDDMPITYIDKNGYHIHSDVTTLYQAIVDQYYADREKNKGLFQQDDYIADVLEKENEKKEKIYPTTGDKLFKLLQHVQDRKFFKFFRERRSYRAFHAVIKNITAKQVTQAEGSARLDVERWEKKEFEALRASQNTAYKKTQELALLKQQLSLNATHERCEFYSFLTNDETQLDYEKIAASQESLEKFQTATKEVKAVFHTFDFRNLITSAQTTVEDALSQGFAADDQNKRKQLAVSFAFLSALEKTKIIQDKIHNALNKNNHTPYQAHAYHLLKIINPEHAQTFVRDRVAQMNDTQQTSEKRSAAFHQLKTLREAGQERCVFTRNIRRQLSAACTPLHTFEPMDVQTLQDAFSVLESIDSDAAKRYIENAKNTLDTARTFTQFLGQDQDPTAVPAFHASDFPVGATSAKDELRTSLTGSSASPGVARPESRAGTSEDQKPGAQKRAERKAQLVAAYQFLQTVDMTGSVEYKTVVQQKLLPRLLHYVVTETRVRDKDRLQTQWLDYDALHALICATQALPEAQQLSVESDHREEQPNLYAFFGDRPQGSPKTVYKRHCQILWVNTPLPTLYNAGCFAQTSLPDCAIETMLRNNTVGMDCLTEKQLLVAQLIAFEKFEEASKVLLACKTHSPDMTLHHTISDAVELFKKRLIAHNTPTDIAHLKQFNSELLPALQNTALATSLSMLEKSWDLSIKTQVLLRKIATLYQDHKRRKSTCRISYQTLGALYAAQCDATTQKLMLYKIGSTIDSSGMPLAFSDIFGASDFPCVQRKKIVAYITTLLDAETLRQRITVVIQGVWTTHWNNEKSEMIVNGTLRSAQTVAKAYSVSLFQNEKNEKRGKNPFSQEKTEENVNQIKYLWALKLQDTLQELNTCQPLDLPHQITNIKQCLQQISDSMRDMREQDGKFNQKIKTALLTVTSIESAWRDNIKVTDLPDVVTPESKHAAKDAPLAITCGRR